MENKIEDQGYSLPPEMSSILTATIAETTAGDVILCHDNAFIYAAKVIKGGGNVTFQKFSLPSVSLLSPIIKNYFMALFDSKRMIIFEVGFSEEGKIVLKFVFNKDKPISGHFLREVADNMAELQIYFPDNDIIIYQFTVNGKIGMMIYNITPQNKLNKCDRQQLYGSKTMLCPPRKHIFFFTNFSNKAVSAYSLGKFEGEMMAKYKAHPISYISKLEQFYVLLSNYYVINVLNPTLGHKIYCEEAHVKTIQQLVDPTISEQLRLRGLNITSYLDMILIEDAEKMVSYIFQVKQKGSALIGIEYGSFNWYWTGSRKLVGLSPNRNRFKIIDEIKINEKESTENSLYSALYPLPARRDLKEKESPKKESPQVKLNSKNIIKEEWAVKDEVKYIEKTSPKKDPQPAVVRNQQSMQQNAVLLQPKRIIQKSKISVSKSVHKSKQIQPISLQQDASNQEKEDKQQADINRSKKPAVDTIEAVEAKPEPAQAAKLEKKSSLGQNIQQECEKIANAVFDKQQPGKQKQEEEAQQEEELKEQADGISSQQKESKKDGDVYPKEQSEASESLVITGEQKGEERGLGNKNIPRQKQKKDKQIKQQQNLPKSLALLIGKSSLGGNNKHPPLNLFNTSINRNNIFNSLPHPSPNSPPNPNPFLNFPFQNPFLSAKPQITSKPNPEPPACKPNHLINNLPVNPKLPVNPNHSSNPSPLNQNNNQQVPQIRKYHSSDQYYNPLISNSPCSAPKEESMGEKQKQEEESNALVEKVKSLFETTTSQLVGLIDELANLKIAEPYLKEKVVEEMRRSLKDTLEKMMVGELTSKIERYFYQIFRQTDQVQQESIKFYKQANSHRCTNIEVQLANQEKIIKEVRDIESNLRFCITNLREGGKNIFENFLRDWAQHSQQTAKLVEGLTATRAKIEAEELERGKRYEETRQHLEGIKLLLSERINMENERKARRLERESAKEAEKEDRAKKERKRKEKRPRTNK